MAPQIGFHNEECRYRLQGKRAVARWLTICCEKEGFTVGEINYVFCSGAKHLDINRNYLGHDYRTDVITFDYTDTHGKILSGDIFIDPETVRHNARFYGVTARNEMLRVLVHGLLHLCGYKDKTEKQTRIMRAREDECLALVDFS